MTLAKKRESPNQEDKALDIVVYLSQNQYFSNILPFLWVISD
jgi:hypothetical protein